VLREFGDAIIVNDIFQSFSTRDEQGPDKLVCPGVMAHVFLTEQFPLAANCGDEGCTKEFLDATEIT